MPILLAIALAGALIVHIVWSVPLGISLLIFFVGWPLIGTLITIDDDLPGGWANPDGTVRAHWQQCPFWGQVVAGLSISAVGFAVDSGWRSVQSAHWWLLAATCGFVAAALVTRRWSLLAGGGLSLAALIIQWSR